MFTKHDHSQTRPCPKTSLQSNLVGMVLAGTSDDHHIAAAIRDHTLLLGTEKR
jgi:hypothetical protein